MSCVEAVEYTGAEIAARVIFAVVLLLCAALFSGLTLGVLGLDPLELEVIQGAGSAEDKRNAALIAPVRKNGNLLLCTLVLGNVAVTSLESILMADLTTGLIGFLLTTVLVVVFGEIVPQAICARYGLLIGARSVPVINMLLTVMYPVTKPLSLMLEFFLGAEEPRAYSQAEFIRLVSMRAGPSESLATTQVNLIEGALSFRSKAVKEVMTPVSNMFAVRSSDVLDFDLMERIFRTGFARIPVWDDVGEDVVGVLFTKDLVLVTPLQRQPVISVVHFFGREKFNVVDDLELLEPTLKKFIMTRQHFAIVRTCEVHANTDPEYTVAGLITMEDILEEIFDEDFAGPVESTNNMSNGSLRSFGKLARPSSEPALDELSDSEKRELSPAEMRAVTAHLTTNVQAFHALGFDATRRLVRGAAVRLFGDDEATGTALFSSSDSVDFCDLILSGSVELQDGRGGASECGAWDVLNEGALLASALSCNAAYALSAVRTLRISAGAYREALDALKLPSGQPATLSVSTAGWRSPSSGGGGGGAASPRTLSPRLSGVSPALAARASSTSAPAAPPFALPARGDTVPAEHYRRMRSAGGAGAVAVPASPPLLSADGWSSRTVDAARIDVRAPAR
jgi:metal transporter CNNM